MGASAPESPITKILIVGDGPLTRSIVHSLSTHPSLHLQTITQVCRFRPLPKHYHSHGKIQISHHQTDFSSPSILAAFKENQHDLVLCTETNVDIQLRIIDAAQSTGVKRFIPSEFSHDTLNPALQSRLQAVGSRFKVLQHLESSGLDWIGIATGIQLPSASLEPLGIDVKWHSASLLGSGDEKVALSTPSHIGNAVSTVVKEWEALKNRYIYACGSLATTNEVVKELESETGAEFAVSYMPAGEAEEEGRRRVEKGWPGVGMKLLERSALIDEEVGAIRAFVERDRKKDLALGGDNAKGIVEGMVRRFREEVESGEGDCGCG